MMQEPILQFPVTCPACALETQCEMPIAVIAHALLSGKGIRLRAQCHDHYWTATFIEREQLRTALRGIRVNTVSTPSLEPNAKMNLEFEAVP
jgi:hypothetical protein